MLVTEALPHKASTKTTSAEDLSVADAFREYPHNKVLPFPTRDEEGRQRYNTFSPSRHYFNREPHWYKKGMSVFKNVWGPRHFSSQSIAFHYLQKAELRQLHALTYNLCPAVDDGQHDEKEMEAGLGNEPHNATTLFCPFCPFSHGGLKTTVLAGLAGTTSSAGISTTPNGLLRLSWNSTLPAHKGSRYDKFRLQNELMQSPSFLLGIVLGSFLSVV